MNEEYLRFISTLYSFYSDFYRPSKSYTFFSLPFISSSEFSLLHHVDTFFMLKLFTVIIELDTIFQAPKSILLPELIESKFFRISHARLFALRSHLYTPPEFGCDVPFPKGAPTIILEKRKSDQSWGKIP